MAAEGEFAFVIAVFAVDQKLISPDLYASIVLAILLSTIIPPFALRFTISYYNNLAQKMLRQAEDMERKRAHSISDAEERTPEEIEADLRVRIHFIYKAFFCACILLNDHLMLDLFFNCACLSGTYQGKQDCFPLYSNSMFFNVGSHPKDNFNTQQTQR